MHDLVHTKWWWLILAELFTLLSVGIQVVVWKLLLNVNGKERKLGLLTSIFFQGIMFSHLLPGIAGGDAFRLLRTSPLVGKGSALSSIIAGRGIELVCVLATALVAVFTLPSWFNQVRSISVIAVCVALLVVYFCIFILEPPKVIADYLERTGHNKLVKMIADTMAAYGDYKSNRTVFRDAVILNTAGWWLFLASIVCLAHSVSVNAGWNLFAVALPLSVFTALIPVSLNGVGVREGVFVWMLAHAGITPSDALAVAILIDLQMIPAALLGALMWLMDR
jgi:uncharacterized protein (TIRG00374 family)